MQLFKRKYMCDRLCQLSAGKREELQLGRNILRVDQADNTLNSQKENLNKDSNLSKASLITNTPQIPDHSFIEVLSLLPLWERILFLQPPRCPSPLSVGMCFILGLFTAIHRTQDSSSNGLHRVCMYRFRVTPCGERGVKKFGADSMRWGLALFIPVLSASPCQCGGLNMLLHSSSWLLIHWTTPPPEHAYTNFSFSHTKNNSERQSSKSVLDQWELWVVNNRNLSYLYMQLCHKGFTYII